MQRHPTRWTTRFASFVGEYTVAALTRDLAGLGEPISDQAVYSWISGRSQPRLRVAEKIVELRERRASSGSGEPLDLRDVSGHRQEVGDGGESVGQRR